MTKTFFNSLLGEAEAIHTLLVTFQPQELQPILRMVRPRRISWAGGQAWTWEGRGHTVTAVRTGMGAAAARRMMAQAIAAWSPGKVLAAGFGGALTSLPPPGGILLASECWRLKAAGQGLHRQEFHPQAPSLPELTAHLHRTGLQAYTGVTISTPGIMAKAAVLPQVSHLPRPVVDLETAAVAAAVGNLPFLALRAITDGGSEEIAPFLAELINRHQGVPLSRLLPALAAQPRRLAYCLHLWRRSRLAGGNLARAVHLSLDYL